MMSAMADDQREGVFSRVDQDVDGFPGQHFGVDPDLGAALAGPGFGVDDDLFQCGDFSSGFGEILRRGGAFEAFP